MIVRGLRDPRDFEHEFQMAQIHQTLDPQIDVVFFMAGHQYTFFSSSTVREIAALGGDVLAGAAACRRGAQESLP